MIVVRCNDSMVNPDKRGFVAGIELVCPPTALEHLARAGRGRRPVVPAQISHPVPFGGASTA